MDQSTLFSDDIQDSMKRLEHVTNTLNYYLELYETFRNKLDTYFKHAQDVIPWTFDDEFVLERVTDFQKRLDEIKVRDISPEFLLVVHSLKII